MTILGSVALLLQLAQATSVLPPLSVRAGDRVRAVPTVVHPEGGIAVRADALAEALGGQVVADAALAGRFRFEVGTTGVDLQAGSALAVVAGDTIPLRAGVFRRGDLLFVPLALATELLPRLGAGVLFDADNAELRRFATVTAARRPPPPRAARARATTIAAPADNARSAAARSAALRRRVVVIDAGHGGPDNGMSGPIGSPRKVFEKNITLAFARVLQRTLQAREVQVVMTRTTDTLIALSDRGRIANQAKADLFLSVHVNAANPRWSNPGGARGFETFFLAEAKTEDERRVEAMENEAIRFETSEDVSRDDPLGFIMRDMAQNEHLRESGRLAEMIQSGMRQVHPGPNRGVKQAGFRVLVTAFMPAVLVEIGFGTNKSEAQYMTDPARQQELAETVADAVVRYLEEYERKVGGGG
ncbi:MAG: N-acetylmuramoyl-L-alanine amidase [Gemmatimonadota bacterium]|nr:N-acetylmuramoyl-L-alanine amidase [Gemmatimonadota bacterium]MDQ8167831.1 N-acetylmuramoyl-L-alanine amidase [Gemmatimonadota bacterium]MDQ8171058.1 N-acetylmuramoyl-L-alanine amidase [Gemmatimonadota bacterium]